MVRPGERTIQELFNAEDYVLKYIMKLNTLTDLVVWRHCDAHAGAHGGARPDLLHRLPTPLHQRRVVL